MLIHNPARTFTHGPVKSSNVKFNYWFTYLSREQHEDYMKKMEETYLPKEIWNEIRKLILIIKYDDDYKHYCLLVPPLIRLRNNYISLNAFEVKTYSAMQSFINSFNYEFRHTKLVDVNFL